MKDERHLSAAGRSFHAEMKNEITYFSSNVHTYKALCHLLIHQTKTQTAALPGILSSPQVFLLAFVIIHMNN